jgi:hypothetical protein
VLTNSSVPSLNYSLDLDVTEPYVRHDGELWYSILNPIFYG